MLNNYKLGIELDPEEKTIIVSAVFDFIKVTNQDMLMFYLNKNFMIKYIRFNGEEIKLKKERMPSKSKFKTANKYYFHDDQVEEYKDNKVEMKYVGKLDKFLLPSGNLKLNIEDFWIPVFEDFPQFMYLSAFYIPKNYKLILQGNLIQHEDKEDYRLLFWERDYMDFDIPLYLAKKVKKVIKKDNFEIYSTVQLSEEQIEILHDNTEIVLESLSEDFKIVINNVVKIIITEDDMRTIGRYFAILNKKLIKPMHVDYIKAVIRAVFNVTPDISPHAWLVYGLKNYFVYLFMEKVQGLEACSRIIEDWKTFLFNMSQPESIMNNSAGKNLDILLDKKAPYIFKMLDVLLKEQNYNDLLSDFVNKDSFHAINTEDLISFLEQNTEKELENFIQQFLLEKDFPSIRINKHIMPDNKGRFKFYGEIIQETKKPFEVPIIFNFELEDGSKIEKVHYLKKFKERYEFIFPSKPVKFTYNKNSDILVQIRS